jgi:hypothetical protein
VNLVSSLLILLPAAAALLYVRSFGVSVAHHDQWDFVPFLDKLFSGTLSVWDLFGQHNEHRLFFPWVVMLLLAVLTEHNNVAEMYLSQAFLVVTLIVLLLVFRDSTGSKLKLLLFVPIAFLIFGLRQHEIMLFGFNVQYVARR